MKEAERLQYEDTSKQLRADLKQFEGDFAKRNSGKKPSRQDIKQNPEIAQKYKEYNLIRDILSGKLPSKSKEPSKSRKRKSDEGLAKTQTPSKRSRPIETPSKSRHVDIQDVTFETPSARKLFSPAIPTSIGPTPQRDGRVLGIFDLLLENEENTPSKGLQDKQLDGFAKIQATPSKRRASEMDDEDVAKLGRTPMSKRIMTETFKTPLKNRDGNTVDGRTPTSVSKLQLSTPSFLRRAPDNGRYVSPAPLRLPRKPLGRSLSSIVASLRKVEEEERADDMDALREMEAEESNTAQKPAKPKEDILEPDSQTPNLLGGFDDENAYDSAPEEQLDRNGQPLRVFKKKGQKRTTRRVNMRPTRARRPQEAKDQQADDDEDDEDQVVPETQMNMMNQDEEPFDLDSASELDGSDYEEKITKRNKVGAESKKTKEAKAAKPEAKEGKVKKAARKVNKLAHANFKRLKLRNHGAKGGPGFGSKFRRRR
ncbi:DNA replication/checkpoint protein [Xylariomycetidae sp. FL2044]|nr:DNA replication/checkpoint protein [Xylariomycetidae sp. FL2044]